MSEQQQVQDRIASSSEVATFFRNDCRGLADSLQLEMVVAQYVLRMRDVESPEGVPIGDACSAGVIAGLEREGDALSHAILRGIEYLGVGEMASRAADAAARLSEHGVGLPPKFGDVTEARAVGAWRGSEGAYEGEFVLFLDFEFPQGRRHSVALFVEPRHGGVVKHIGLLDPTSDIGPDNPLGLEPLDLGEAGALLRRVLTRSYGPEFDLTDDYRVLIASARAREM